MHRSGLTELEIVLAVTRQQSFRAAARELGMSATAVSNAVAGLESRLNVRLFNRTTRSVALTEQGQRYVARIAPALAEIQRAAEEIATEPGNPTGTLRINAPRECVSLLFRLFDTYLQRYPQMRLDITTESRLIDIVSEGFDAGIRLAESVPQDMIAVALTPDARMLIVGSPDYFARYGTPRSPDDLQQHQSIGMRMSHGGVYHWELEHHQQKFTVNIPPRIVVSEMQAIIARRWLDWGWPLFRNGLFRTNSAAANWSASWMNGAQPLAACAFIIRGTGMCSRHCARLLNWRTN